MVVKKKVYECRYPGCPKTFKSRSGLTYHEKTVHGELYPKLYKKQSNVNGEKNSFIDIKEVKFVAKKEVKDDEKDTDECGKCGKAIAVDSKYCPHCGVEFK